MKKLSLVFASFLLMPFFALSLSTNTAGAAVDAKSAICEGLQSATATGSCGTDENDAGSGVGSILELVIDILSIVGAVIAIIMIIIGGIRFTTSQGDSSSTAGAKNTIIYALVGLVIIALAQIIVQFVAGRLEAGPAPETIQGTPAPPNNFN